MKALFASIIQAFWIGFDTSFVTFLCHQKYTGSWLLVSTCLFNSSIFCGTVAAALLSHHENNWLYVFACASTKALVLLLMAVVDVNELVLPLLFVSGLCIGFIQSTFIHYLAKKTTAESQSMLVAVVFACFAAGTFFCSILLESKPFALNVGNSQRDRGRTQIALKTYSAIQVMLVQSRFDSRALMAISAAFQSASLYHVFSMWKCSMDAVSSNTLAVLTLSSFLSFFASALTTAFPYYLFAYSYLGNRLIYYITFSMAFLVGRVLYVGITMQKVGNTTVVLAASLVVCGTGICLSSYGATRLLSSILYGLSLSVMLPLLTVYLSQLPGASLHVLICGSAFAPLFFPLLLTQLLGQYGVQLFPAVNLVSLLAMVFIFVCLLNAQSKMDKPLSEPQARRPWQHTASRQQVPEAQRTKPASPTSSTFPIDCSSQKLQVDAEQAPTTSYFY